MGVRARPEIPFVPDPASTSPPSVVPIELDLPEPLQVPQVRMPQRAPATPPALVVAVAPEIPPPVVQPAPVVQPPPPPPRSTLLPVVLTLGVVLGFGSVLVGLSVVMLATVFFLV